MAVERCSRCGTARRGDLQVCVRCETPFVSPGDPDVDMQRPAAPSTFQTHGTMGLMVVLGVILFGVLLAFTGRDVGPFKGEILGQPAAASADTVTVTVRITNTGERAGRGNCRVGVVNSGGVKRVESQFLTAKMAGGASVTQQVTVRTVNGRPAEVTCS
jgi:hypothetical protein